MDTDRIDGSGGGLSGGLPRVEVTPRQKRERLFKKSRPFLRPFKKEDLGWIWAAYMKGSFGFPEGLSQEELTARVLNGIKDLVTFIVEDDNPQFKDGRGPVGLVSMATDGYRYEPNVAIFKWATKRNILRGFVGFFQWAKNSREIGICELKVPTSKSRILMKMRDYGVLYPRGNEIVFRVSGKKKGGVKHDT